MNYFNQCVYIFDQSFFDLTKYSKLETWNANNIEEYTIRYCHNFLKLLLLLLLLLLLRFQNSSLNIIIQISRF